MKQGFVTILCLFWLASVFADMSIPPPPKPVSFPTPTAAQVQQIAPKDLMDTTPAHQQPIAWVIVLPTYSSSQAAAEAVTQLRHWGLPAYRDSANATVVKIGPSLRPNLLKAMQKTLKQHRYAVGKLSAYWVFAIHDQTTSPKKINNVLATKPVAGKSLEEAS